MYDAKTYIKTLIRHQGGGVSEIHVKAINQMLAGDEAAFKQEFISVHLFTCLYDLCYAFQFLPKKPVLDFEMKCYP